MKRKLTGLMAGVLALWLGSGCDLLPNPEPKPGPWEELLGELGEHADEFVEWFEQTIGDDD